MKLRETCFALLAALSLVSTAVPASADSLKNIVLVHGAWVDASDPAQFPKLFAPDLPRERAEFVAHSQVLAAAQVFSTPLTAAAWKTKPSWGIVAGSDQIINPDLERRYYSRAKSPTVEIKGASHAVYESHPKEVAAVIEKAARSIEK